MCSVMKNVVYRVILSAIVPYTIAITGRNEDIPVLTQTFKAETTRDLRDTSSEKQRVPHR